MAVAGGLAAGAAAYLALASWIRSLLFNVEFADPASMGAALLIVAAAAALAAALALARALRLDPAALLKEQE